MYQLGMKQFPFSPLGSCGLWTGLFSICLMIFFFCSSLFHPICTWSFMDALNPWEREKEIGEIVKVGHGLSNSPQRWLLKWKKNQTRRKYRVIREKEGEARKWKAAFEKLEENFNRCRNRMLLLSRFSRARLCAAPQTAAHQAPPSLGLSRQEHWSGLPFPSPMHESEKWKGSHSVVSNSSRPHGLQPTRLLRPWNFPGQSTGVGCHYLLHGGASTC